MFQPHKMLFQRQLRESFRNGQRLLQKRTPLWNEGKIRNRGFPGAGSVTGLKSHLNQKHCWCKCGFQAQHMPNPGSLLSSSEDAPDRNEICWRSKVQRKVHVATRQGVISIFFSMSGCFQLAFPGFLHNRVHLLTCGC